MNPRFPAIVAAIFLFHVSFVQSPSPSQTKPSVQVAAQLNKDLNAKKLKPGDKVEAQVIQDVLLNGRIMIPRESKLVGHVTDVEALSETDGESQVSLVFEQGQLKNGGMLNFHGVIEALGPPLPDPFLETEMASASPYNPSTAGHPMTGPMGQSNATTQVTDGHWGDSGARSIQDRQRALDDARRTGTATNARPRNGALSVSSRGVFNLPGLFLSHVHGSSTIISVGKNVHLQSGSQVVMTLQSVSVITAK
jgi:hypothetical protein